MTGNQDFGLLTYNVRGLRNPKRERKFSISLNHRSVKYYVYKKPIVTMIFMNNGQKNYPISIVFGIVRTPGVEETQF